MSNLISLNKFIIKSSGDVDVIQRQEKLLRRMQSWPIISQTPLAMTFLKDIIAEAFPEDAQRYEQVLQEDQLGKQLVMGLSGMLSSAVTNDDGSLKPEYSKYQQQFQQIQQMAAKYLTGGTQQNQLGNGQQISSPGTSGNMGSREFNAASSGAA